MDLDFTAEQELLRDTVRRTCERHAGLESVRKLENDATGYSPALWGQLAELGILGLTIDERYGGSGMSMLEAAIVYQELGRALTPSPHFVSCVLAAGMAGRCDDEETRARILAGIASGETVMTVASLEPDGGFGPSGITLRGTADGDGWRLSGEKVHVPYAAAAQAVVVLARVTDDGERSGGDGHTGSGVAAFLVETGAPGVSVEQQLTVASDSQFRIRFDDVRVDASHQLIAAGAAWPAWHETMLDGVILLAAQAAGGARAAFDLTVSYAGTREQFDKPLAAFQAISHYLADSATAVDGAEALVWEAAWARSEGRSVEALAPMAKRFACTTFRDVTATGVQIFGGNGFTVEFDIQLYFRRAKSWQLNNWDDRYLDALIASELLDH